MGGLDIHLGDGQISLDHVQCGVTKDPLQSVDIAAVAKKVDREGVAKTVDSWILHPPCPGSQAIDRFEQIVASELKPLSLQNAKELMVKSLRSEK